VSGRVPSPRPAPAAISLSGDVVGSAGRWDIILCGDVCYEAPMTRRILPWLRRLAGSAEVWIADPGRAYLPREGLSAFAEYRVPTTRELEDRLERVVTLFRLDALNSSSTGTPAAAS
jgi:predicted nicotinamide N-methyase